jgi:CheY-like chemotaxis protein
MNILIVDDNERRAAGLKEYLIRQAHLHPSQISVSDCVDEAKKKLRDIYFDLLVLDVVLPKRTNEKATAAHGLRLLDQISRSAFLRKPEKIVGITAHLHDIQKFRNEFEKNCAVVVEADFKSDVWKHKIASLLSYTTLSQVHRIPEAKKIAVLTVHGIQTFGAWQERLMNFVNSRTSVVSFNSYKYGYFSALAFLIPALRTREVNRMASHLRQFLVEANGQRVVLFSHSFGTYLLANSLTTLHSQGVNIRNMTLVLSGSVLNSDFDWRFLHSCQDTRVVNECGDNDYVLWISRGLVLGVGMAGKTGFYGIHNDRFVNRFFKGGHSLYFQGDDFMLRHWVPIILSDSHPVPQIDQRSPGFLMHGIFDKVIQVAGRAKWALYLGLLAWAVKLAWPRFL